MEHQEWIDQQLDKYKQMSRLVSVWGEMSNHHEFLLRDFLHDLPPAELEAFQSLTAKLEEYIKDLI